MQKPSREKLSEPKLTEKKPELVVGIGASAGGLKAFKEFVSSIPADSGMAFVLLPHLDPKHSSMMTELLTGQASIPVCQAQEGQAIEADRVYILPPAQELTIHKGVLHLSVVDKPSRPWVAIDCFLRSLADDQSERAVGIIFSGTGSHGTLGLSAIKRSGGLVLAQDPETSDYPQMPANAIASGLVDLIMAPASMPAALIDYVKYPYLRDTAAEAQASEEEINHILTILRAGTKYDFREYRRNMLVRRIQRRMSLCHINSLQEYEQYLRNHVDEVTALNKDLLISVTAFFRDPEAFQLLGQQVIHELVDQLGEDEILRVWVPGCASGEEAYSLAMLLTEVFETAKRQAGFQIFATDLDEEALVVARHATYPESISIDVSQERLKRFFFKTDGGKYKINKALRDTVIFATHNLIGDTPFSHMHLISCRNLFIYLQPELQSKVIQLFHFALKQNGFLFLGPSESIGRQTELFKVVSKKWRIFRRIPSSVRPLIDIPLKGIKVPHIAPEKLATLQEFRPYRRRATIDAAELAHKLLLSSYAPASVLINAHYEILHFYGSTTPYLQLPSGEPTRDLMAMVREGLGSSIRIAVHRALQEKKTVVDRDVLVNRNNQSIPCTITVRPIDEPKEIEGLLLISFEDNQPVISESVKQKTIDLAAGKASKKELKIIEQLEREIEAMQDSLQSTVEEMESANEELKASNEEIMSMNEELQSANEELESSREELQSMNEELNTVNTELLCKVDELEISRDHVSNLLASTDIATLFLDRQMHIKLFNPSVIDLLNLRKGDIDRPISDFSGKVNIESLLQSARQVLDKLVPVENDILVEIGYQLRCYLQRVVPYRTVNDRIDGVVITFVDITSRYQMKEELEKRVMERTVELEESKHKLSLVFQAVREREQRLSAIMSYMAEAVIVFGKDGIINDSNKAVEKIFGYSFSEIEGSHLKLLIPSLFYIGQERGAIDVQQSMPLEIMGRKQEYSGYCKDGSIIPLELIITEIDHLDVYIGIVHDITQQRKLEREVTDISTREQENTGRELHDGLGQQLTALNMLATRLKQELSRKGFSEAMLLDEFILLLKDAGQEVSRISHGLAPISITPEGLQNALARLVHSLADNNGKVNCRFESNTLVTVTDQDVANQLYRIAQEAFNNALKYAQAKTIVVTLQMMEGCVELCIRDDGKGFDLKKVGDGGVGLEIMRYRAKIIGAQFSIDTRPGDGTTVRCRLGASGKP